MVLKLKTPEAVIFSISSAYLMKDWLLIRLNEIVGTSSVPGVLSKFNATKHSMENLASRKAILKLTASCLETANRKEFMRVNLKQNRLAKNLRSLIKAMTVMTSMG